jgi:hypothetical protein
MTVNCYSQRLLNPFRGIVSTPAYTRPTQPSTDKTLRSFYIELDPESAE